MMALTPPWLTFLPWTGTLLRWGDWWRREVDVRRFSSHVTYNVKTGNCIMITKKQKHLHSSLLSLHWSPRMRAAISRLFWEGMSLTVSSAAKPFLSRMFTSIPSEEQQACVLIGQPIKILCRGTNSNVSVWPALRSFCTTSVLPYRAASWRALPFSVWAKWGNRNKKHPVLEMDGEKNRNEHHKNKFVVSANSKESDFA